LEFVTPLFLLCILAAAIPLALHLISNIRAEETQFPTLRFLKMSMEKTARRRRIEDLLLLLLRFEVGVRWHTILECTLGVLISFVKPHTEKPPLAISRSFVLQT